MNKYSDLHRRSLPCGSYSTSESPLRSRKLRPATCQSSTSKRSATTTPPKRPGTSYRKSEEPVVRNIFKTYTDLESVIANKNQMSNITKLENQKTFVKTQILNSQKYSSQILEQDMLQQIPTASDFNKVIERLGMVAQNLNLKHRRLILQEDNPIQAMLDKEDTQYAKIAVKGKTTPLNITIQRHFGRLKIFTSTTVQDPNSELCDQALQKDNITVDDPGAIFRTENVYICIFALEDSSFTISAYFGKTKPLSFLIQLNRQATKIQKPEIDPLLNSDLESQYLRTPIFQQRKNLFTRRSQTDFIQRNKRVVSPESKEYRSQLMEMRRRVSERRSQAIIKRKHVLEQKKQKIQQFLLRNQARKEKKLLEQTIEMLQEIAIDRQKRWLLFIYSIQASKSIRERLILSRLKIIETLQKSYTVRRIQYQFRRQFGQLQGMEVIHLRAKNLLSFYAHNTIAVQKSKTNSLLIKFFRESSATLFVPYKFQKFYNGILKIQRT